MIYELCGHRIDVPIAEKVLWPKHGYTVHDLVNYYVGVWPWLERYLDKRPVVYETYPGTIDGPHDFQQDPPPSAPRWVKRVRIAGRERMVTYVVADSPAAIVYLVKLYAVTLHVWMSRITAIEHPDFFLLDLDPVGSCTLARLARVALLAREVLSKRGFREARVKFSGAHGVHVGASFPATQDYAAARATAQDLARELVRLAPKDVTIERTVSARPDGTVYVDYNQVGRGMSIVPPFSARACDDATVAMPLEWDEIETHAKSRSRRPPSETLARWTIVNTVDYLRTHGDPWSKLLT